MGRFTEIANILVKYGFEDIITRTGIGESFPFKNSSYFQKKFEKLNELNHWQRVRKTLEELGPTYLKFGQMMSNRPDIIPRGLIKELELLQDRIPPFSSDLSIKLVEEELNAKIEDVFSEFNSTPIASASIAQVHRAVLRTGEVVAVKVQRPNIETTIKKDVQLLKDLAELLEQYYPKIRQINFLELVLEFEKSIIKELNFITEANNAVRFRNNMKNTPHIVVPRIFKNYSTKKILVMDFIDGIKISNHKTLQENGYDPKLIASRGIEIYLKQVFEHGFFHADPHPGNLMVLPQNKICLIDFGIMGIVHENDKDLLTSLFIAIEARDSKKLIQSLQRISEQPIKNKRKLEYSLIEFIDDYYYYSLDDIDAEELVKRFMNLLIDHNIKIPANFFLILKTIAFTEGVGKSLDPDLSVLSHLEPYSKKLFWNQFKPKGFIKQLLLSGLDWQQLITDLPGDIKEIVKNTKHGELKIKMEHQGLEQTNNVLKQITNRIAFALIVSAMILSSSVIIMSDIPPKVYNIPVIGLVGFIMAALFSLWLLYIILRNRNL